MKHQVVNEYTPLHFGVGLSAGALGIDPHVAALAFIGTRVLALALDAGFNKALFMSEHGQSAAQEIANLSMELLGVYVGEYVRERFHAHQPLVPALSSPPVYYPEFY